MGADYIEQDLQVTSDGVLVVMHDGTLNRTTRGAAENCTGAVNTKTLAQIKTCSAGQWFGPEWVDEKIPTLEEVFQRYGKTVNYYIETKQPDPADHMEEKLLALLDKYGLREPAVVALAGADPVLQRRLAEDGARDGPAAAADLPRQPDRRQHPVLRGLRRRPRAELRRLASTPTGSTPRTPTASTCTRTRSTPRRT